MLVPRPISSRMSRERPVAWFRISAVSTISTIKVERPACSSSWAPMRVKMRSTRPISAISAGTKLPIWAMSTISATWRKKVDLPLMLGPVMIWMRSASRTARRWARSVPAADSVRPPDGARARYADVFVAQRRPDVPPLLAAAASAAATSIAASTRAVASSRGAYRLSSWHSSVNSRRSISRMRSSALRISVSYSFSSGVM